MPQLLGAGLLNLNEEEYIRMYAIMEDHWRDVAEEDENKNNIHTLRWEVYVRDKEDLIKKEFLVSVTHPKGGQLFGLV